MKKKLGWVLSFVAIVTLLVMLGCYNASRHHKFDKPTKAKQAFEGAGQRGAGSSVSQNWVLVTSKIVPIN